MEIDYFNKILDKYVASEPWKRKIGRYYPSEVGYCKRKIFYSILMPKEKDPRVLKILAMGNVIHDFIAKVLKSEKTDEDVALVAEEMPFLLERNGYVISGRIDDLFLVRKGTKLMLLEVKSTKNIEWIRAKGEANDSHIDQITLYMYALDIRNGGILYVNKEDLDTVFIDVEYDIERVAKILQKFDDVHQHLVTHTLPPKEAQENPKMRWQCQFCEYREECMKDFVPPPLEEKDYKYIKASETQEAPE